MAILIVITGVSGSGKSTLAAALLAAGAIAAPCVLLTLVARSVDGAAAAGFWLGAAVASVVGNFPTPIAGAGVTPILAYALTWALLAAKPADREASA